MKFWKKTRLCSGCLGKTQSMKDCKFSPRGIIGCDKKHKCLLHEQKGDIRTNVQQESTNSLIKPASRGLLPIVRVTLIDADRGKSVNTCSLQDTGSKVILIDKNLKEMLNLIAKKCRREPSGMISAINIYEKVSVKKQPEI